MDTNKNISVPYSNADTVALYRFIYKNAQFGMGILGKLLEQQYRGNVAEIMAGQRRGYTAILRDAANALALCGARHGGMSLGEKLWVCLEIRLKLGNQCDSSNAVEYLITATSLLEIEGAKQKRLFQDASENCKALMERLLRFEEANCRKLKEYL